MYLGLLCQEGLGLKIEILNFTKMEKKSFVKKFFATTAIIASLIVGQSYLSEGYVDPNAGVKLESWSSCQDSHGRPVGGNEIICVTGDASCVKKSCPSGSSPCTP